MANTEQIEPFKRNLAEILQKAREIEVEFEQLTDEELVFLLLEKAKGGNIPAARAAVDLMDQVAPEGTPLTAKEFSTLEELLRGDE